MCGHDLTIIRICKNTSGLFNELLRMPLEDQNLASQKLFESLGYRLEKHLEIFQEMHYMSGSKDGKCSWYQWYSQWQSNDLNRFALFRTFVWESVSLLRLHFAEVPEVLPVVEEELAEDRLFSGKSEIWEPQRLQEERRPAEGKAKSLGDKYLLQNCLCLEFWSVHSCAVSEMWHFRPIKL